MIGEIGTSKNEWTENEHKVFEAGVLAQRQTNAVMITHTTLGTLMKEQVQFFEENQVNLKKVIISHVALANDLGSIEDILHAGVNVAFDTIGKIKYLPDEDRIRFMSDVGATCCDYFNQKSPENGTSFLQIIGGRPQNK